MLEHLGLEDREQFYGFCDRMLSPSGACVIGVPVEVGPTLLIKQAGRRLLKSRPKEYGAAELLRVVAGRRVEDPKRLESRPGLGYLYSHHGFDYRVLRDELDQRQAVEEVRRSPLGALPAPLGNQAVVYRTRLRGHAPDG